jgi:hypothetical protein
MLQEVNGTEYQISKLVLVNKEGQEVLNWNENGFERYVLSNGANNKNLLIAFCKEQVAKGEDRNELIKFYNYYIKKDWRKKMNCPKLWILWKARI